MTHGAAAFSRKQLGRAFVSVFASVIELSCPGRGNIQLRFHRVDNFILELTTVGILYAL